MPIPSIFSKDWFTRNSESFTVADRSKSIGWEDLVSGKYSKYLYSQSIVNALLNSSKDMADELKHLLFSMSIEKNVYVDTKGDDSYTDGRNIVVSTHFANTAVDAYDKMDIMIGLAIHEACHCKFTDFGYMLQNYNKVNPVVKQICNILEDEMIENKMGNLHPGFANFLSKVKYYYFGTLGNDFMSNDGVNDLDRIFKLFFYIIRYPKQVPSYDSKFLAEKEDVFNKIHDILERHECFSVDSLKSTTVRSLDAAIEIYDLFKEEIEKEYEKKKEDNKFSEEGNDNGQGTDWGSNDIDDYSDDVEIEKEKIKDFNEQLKEILDKLNSCFNEGKAINDHVSTTYQEENNKKISKIIKKCEAENAKGLANTAFGNFGNKIGNFNQISNNPVKYEKIATTMRPYIQRAKSIILTNSKKETIHQVNYRRNGTLDPSRLADAMQNINTVYRQNIVKQDKNNGSKYALVLMLDESGSMYNLSEDVSALAITFAEALKSYPEIELYVYGYGDTHSCYVDKYHKDLTTLANIQKQGDQNDYESYKAIIGAVKKQTNLPIVTIAITDSFYCQYNKIKELVQDEKKKNVTMNLVALNTCANTDIAKINDDIYGEGNWVSASTESQKSIYKLIDDLANIIRKNYDRRK